MSPDVLVIASLIGLVAGVVGGLAGIGGSIIMLPGLALFVGFSSPEKVEQHLYAAAAMCANFVVALPAARTHLKRVQGPGLAIVARLLPATLIGIFAGVLVSNRVDGQGLKSILAGFIAAYCLYNLARAIWPGQTSGEADAARPATWGLLATGGVTGFAAGLLGIGGGIVMVPLLQLALRVPMKLAIACSAGVMTVSSVVGATMKVGTLGQHGLAGGEALLLAAAMSPGAVIGSVLGSRLTHVLPARWFRLILSTVLLAAAARMAGLF